MTQQADTLSNRSLGSSETTQGDSMASERGLFQPKHNTRRLKERAFHGIIALATFVALGTLFVLLARVFEEGWHWLDLQFLDSFPSRFPEKAGIKSAIWGSIWLGGLTLLFSVVFGVGAAIYLEELSPKNRLNRWLEVNIATLAGVPSIIYGMLGLTLFVRFMNLDRSVVAGALTLSLLVMPVIIIATREALKSVPDSIRLGAAALGSTRWQAVRDHVIPSALPGILTGIILAMARAAGEAAPLIMIGALTYVAFTPEGPLDAFTALPIQIFNWTSRPQVEFHELAAAGIIVLLGFLIVCNSLAIILRLKWKEEKR
ncbi:phosphate ABC transporter permease PstA [Pseudobacteriovorax antillogorgiicola]|uniref:Phosphate transport system permease protein PstA n=1 Tax=Pseudobacteriovorax antillogorgiicola TaxID=1513793 RepID=A0A1Y6CN69_9BACT|nr:phosphate ABC transporter permease PstA [Pseudobacteriovorax antillogorgiicola]TCS44408.1 phosphate ABC transporter membrane protein 2 (PhoT family) [Pseudobacteriovorax antillogorgiicola]SMF79211.1 phosphate ABC transporter membrane protein 2, PhoT family [Pseudobacteriovorax antillogorgiicola]